MRFAFLWSLCFTASCSLFTEPENIHYEDLFGAYKYQSAFTSEVVIVKNEWRLDSGCTQDFDFYILRDQDPKYKIVYFGEEICPHSGFFVLGITSGELHDGKLVIFFATSAGLGTMEGVSRAVTRKDQISGSLIYKPNNKTSGIWKLTLVE